MKIEVWSDFVCPFCYIGKRRLEEALAQFPHRDRVDIVFKSFELDPNASKNTTLSVHEHLASKYGTTVEQAKKMSENVAEQAASVGLDFKFDTMIHTNTFDAHRLAKFAEEKGKDAALTERLLKAYFTDSKHIGDHETLKELAIEAELDGEEAEGILKGSDYEEAVRADEAAARQIGVQGVPFFVLNGKYAISGAQPAEVFKSALQQVWEEENRKSPLQPIAEGNAENAFCTDEGCEASDSTKK
ncbi:DsbA family oxidoreductase [Bacillus taeanensis]|uniref:DsbA family oxidoreductase n=1 Tax=Bacillus taeanensis TaxID=273032 RepID=A0A366XVK8_9BACI|nr:DsbA family oxidoreductase [Bacillus taeanensis]RBW69185.1 DsbA family oxidoreductase [Bacillus taeanensis]